ncbi:bacterio-opsin activator HTH domain-containing protein [Natrinema pellirubrum DSM 15624]|uniref:Bacterio-opsin activator HTH domain-containing protein n=1 Tax=Natrinema pellirubrum (strain DSM 15624 / CIP 106293 / JCM 10476 / NCIMB 786 / 157) TaxID=797303 RepID=L0JIW1_NATP1|nr:bacterio-opsin activator domain-containing protein [Natrinema pellirubrum]AGB30512.1 putative DNA binding protein [Natrinema pellirubrum DSM 15624]ELY77281.1 bacterio-opsin activator HTH domain-containing protein [Natrinema pellirubrum DSM 15624]
MSLIAKFSIKSDDFALNHALTAAPEMVVAIEQVVATMEDRIMPYFWVSGGDHAAFEAAFRDDDSVTNIAAVDEADDAKLYRGEWTRNVETIVYAYVELGATILRATGKAASWDLRMRFDDRESLSRFRTYCDDHDITADLERITEQEQPMASARYGLTPKQRETLVTALEVGYYEVPQAVTMDELADRMGVSQQALSKRFRGAYENLIASTLTVGDADKG